MDAPHIPFSPADLERQRLESTLDRDLSSLSLTFTSAPSTSFASSSTVSSLEVGRAANVSHLQPDFHTFDDTPRGKRCASYAHTDLTAGVSPTSTAGHHISAATLGAGVFRRAGADRDRTNGDEFDPDRSLGRLVGELAKAMGDDRMNPKPVSPFVSPRGARPPSPAPNSIPNLSYSLNRNDPLPSPPHSRTVSSASTKSANSRASGGATRQATSGRTALGETNRHNVASPPKASRVSKKSHNRSSYGFKVDNDSADITGMTGLLATPARGAEFEGIGKNSGPTDGAGSGIPAALSTLSARLRALETENGVSRRRVRELEAEVERAREEVYEAQKAKDARLRDVIAEKSALEDLVHSLRDHLKRLTAELEANKTLLADLRRGADETVRDDISGIRREVERLSREVARLNSIANQGLLERARSRENRSVRIDALDLADDEVERVRHDVNRRAAQASAAPAVSFAAQHTSIHDDLTPLPSQLRQGLHAAAAVEPALMPPSAAPPTRTQQSSGSEGEESPTPASRTHSRQSSYHAPAAEHSTPTRNSVSSSTSSGRRRRHRVAAGPDSPFPSIRAQDEEEFFSPSRPGHRSSKSQSQPPRASRLASENPSKAGKSTGAPLHSVRAILEGADVPPQTVLTRVISELEADFAHYKSIYVELADQYKVLDAASAVTKRHVLAEHLKEVIDCLEQKADHIAALYSLMHVEDRPVSPSTAPRTFKSVNDLWRAVRDSLGEDAVRRLEADGLFRHV